MEKLSERIILLMRLDVKGIICSKSLEFNEHIIRLAESGHHVTFVDKIESTEEGFLHVLSLTKPATGEYTLASHRNSKNNRLPRGVFRKRGFNASVILADDGLNFTFYH